MLNDLININNVTQNYIKTEKNNKIYFPTCSQNVNDPILLYESDWIDITPTYNVTAPRGYMAGGTINALEKINIMIPEYYLQHIRCSIDYKVPTNFKINMISPDVTTEYSGDYYVCDVFEGTSPPTSEWSVYTSNISDKFEINNTSSLYDCVLEGTYLGNIYRHQGFLNTLSLKKYTGGLDDEHLNNVTYEYVSGHVGIFESITSTSINAPMSKTTTVWSSYVDEFGITQYVSNIVVENDTYFLYFSYFDSITYGIGDYTSYIKNGDEWEYFSSLDHKNINSITYGIYSRSVDLEYFRIHNTDGSLFYVTSYIPFVTTNGGCIVNPVGHPKMSTPSITFSSAISNDNFCFNKISTLNSDPVWEINVRINLRVEGECITIAETTTRRVGTENNTVFQDFYTYKPESIPFQYKLKVYFVNRTVYNEVKNYAK